MGSRCAQYQAPLPFIAFVRTITSPSYRFCTAFPVSSSAVELPVSTAGAAADDGGGVDAFVAAIALAPQIKKQLKKTSNFRQFGMTQFLFQDLEFIFIIEPAVAAGEISGEVPWRRPAIWVGEEGIWGTGSRSDFGFADVISLCLC